MTSVIFSVLLLDNVQESLESLALDLKDVEERREKLIKGSRDAVMLCSKSIVDLHHGNYNEAENKMNNAKKILEELRQYVKGDLFKYLHVAEQELTEAYCLKAVIDNENIPGNRELEVSGSSYLTGLLDAIGEIKRLVLDRLRQNKSNDASRYFTIMQEIYSFTYPFAVYDNVISGTRRKLDVAKILIEDIRAVITEDTRRTEMIDKISMLEKKLT